MKLSSNRQLYDFLVSLSTALGNRGNRDLSAVATAASRFASGMSTEFLGESRIALRRVLREEAGTLNDNERADLQDVLRQLDSAFDDR
jgi:hypothetical protein